MHQKALRAAPAMKFPSTRDHEPANQPQQAGVEWRPLQEAYGKLQDAIQRYAVDSLERAVGIEPTFEAWKASVLPLYDARADHQPDYTSLLQNSGRNEILGCFTTSCGRRRKTQGVLNVE
jgi:hypothetical protein